MSLDDVAQFGFIPPNKNWAYGAAVTGPTSDSDHSLAWAVDGRNNFPLRVNGAAATITLTKTAAPVSAVSIANHRIKVNTALTGGVSGSLLAPSVPENDVLINPWLQVAPFATPASVGSLILTIAANPEDVVIGEIIAGEMVLLPQPFWQDDSWRITDFADEPSLEEMLSEGVARYSEDAEARAWTGRQVYTTAMVDKLISWKRAQKGYRLPSLCVPDLTKNDAFHCFMILGAIVAAEAPGYWEVEFTIVELPRTRW